MITSVWICPACGQKEKYSDANEYDLSGIWMRCDCPKCDCEFMVNVVSTELEDF
jgi:hypothetical protein